MKRLIVAVMLALAFSAAQSQAATIGSTPGLLDPNPNDVIPGTEGFYGANLYLIAGADTVITVEFVGKEAQYVNHFYLSNGGPDLLDINNQTTPVGTTFTPTISPGLISFRFTTNSGTGVVTNGSNTLPALNLPNFFVSLSFSPLITGRDTTINGITPNFGTTAWIALDDTGAGPDDNHDDLVVRLTVTGGTFQAPDGGATLTLLGSALLGLGALRRRFNV